MNIRRAERSDAAAILELIRELAEYEKAPQEVTNTAEAIARDGFGEHPRFGCLVAEEEGVIIGMSLWYTRYSTWKGPTLYLEDLIVKEAHRGKGAGKLLFEATLRIARETGMTGMSWQVLDWNEPAIRFYEQYGCRFDNEWTNCRISFE
jgi:GNAT superfamily N-acetyltransferase